MSVDILFHRVHIYTCHVYTFEDKFLCTNTCICELVISQDLSWTLT